MIKKKAKNKGTANYEQIRSIITKGHYNSPASCPCTHFCFSGHISYDEIKDSGTIIDRKKKETKVQCMTKIKDL